jgi:hypothetical protein
MVTAGSIQSLVIAEVGDTADGLLTQQMPLIWASYADKAGIAPRLQELYAKRRAIDIVLGSLRNSVGFSMSGDLSLRLDQRTEYLMERRKETLVEIRHLEAIARSGRAPAIAPLSTTEMEPQPIIPAPTLVPDRNAEVFIGSPYWPSMPSGEPLP